MTPDRMATARAVRRRLADMRLAAQLNARGWRVNPPEDDIQEKAERALARD